MALLCQLESYSENIVVRSHSQPILLLPVSKREIFVVTDTQL